MLFNIKERREELRLTLEEIGKFVGVSKGTVKKWESGLIKNMRRDKLVKLADILQVSPMDFLQSTPVIPQLLIQKKVPLNEELKIEYKKLILSVFDTIPSDPMVIVLKDNNLILLNTKNKNIEKLLNDIN